MAQGEIAELVDLRFKIPLKPKQHYHGEETVYSRKFYSRLNELCEQYKDNEPMNGFIEKSQFYRSMGKDYAPFAQCLTFHSGGFFFMFQDKHLHILYTHDMGGVENTFVRGHEQTHVLENLGHIDRLSCALAEAGMWADLKSQSSNDMTINPKELKANIGGVYACLLKGFSLDEIMGYTSEKTRDSELIPFELFKKSSLV